MKTSPTVSSIPLLMHQRQIAATATDDFYLVKNTASPKSKP